MRHHEPLYTTAAGTDTSHGSPNDCTATSVLIRHPASRSCERAMPSHGHPASASCPRPCPCPRPSRNPAEASCCIHAQHASLSAGPAAVAPGPRRALRDLGASYGLARATAERMGRVRVQVRVGVSWRGPPPRGCRGYRMTRRLCSAGLAREAGQLAGLPYSGGPAAVCSVARRRTARSARAVRCSPRGAVGRPSSCSHSRRPSSCSSSRRGALTRRRR